LVEQCYFVFIEKRIFLVLTAGEIFEELFYVGGNFLFLRQILHLC
jgi:hypothetical protein